GSESRPFSTVGNPNTYGHFLSVALGPAAGLAVLYSGPCSKPVRLIAGALAFGILVTAGIVATRGAVLGIAAAFVLVPTLAIRSYGGTRRNFTIVVGAVIAAAALTVLIVTFSPLGGRLQATLRGFATRDRLLVYEG